MFNFFKKQKGTGALLDTRTPDQKAKDYYFNEIVVSADPVTWTEKNPSQWRSFSIRDQDGSSSCVAQSIAKLAEILYFLKTEGKEKVQFSASYIYKNRSNFPNEGMIGVNSFNIWKDKGVPLEALLPSQKINETTINSVTINPSVDDVSKVFKVDNYVQYQPKFSFEEIASTIQRTGKGVMVWFGFNRNEWTDIPVVNGVVTIRHSVVAIDFTLYQGKKYLIIEDSWGNFNAWQGRRLISEEYFMARNIFAAYPINFKNLEEQKPSKPVYIFNVDLKFGQTSVDIRALQDILKYEGFFPTNIESTEYYGAITAKAVLQWQLKHQVDSEVTLNQLLGRVVGPKTRAVLNKLYSQ